MTMTLTEDDRLWRDQNFPNMSDEEFEKIVHTFGGNGNGNGEVREKEVTKRKIIVKKYTAKGTMPLHECVIIGQDRKFVYLDKNKKPQFVDSIERTNDILIPADTFDTQNPIPFIFESKEKFIECLERAKEETLDSLFGKVETINRKYVDVEDHYHVLFTADMIWTWLQDRFGYTHYVIITGDNGSGKNSQLLAFKFLGYRVFYIVSATAPNYFTRMGNVEEGQITIAEDEADDIASDKEKRNIIKNGYASGGSVPKVELEGGRKSDDWLVYCQKWFSMEELPTIREMKGIIDRSFVLRFTAGDPQYNIKDVINSAGEPKFKPLYDELIDTRNILFCWRLLRHDDVIPDIGLNVKNRSAELTKPLIRLFQNSPIALGKILYSLSQFMTERNEIKGTSFESMSYKVIEDLIEERKIELAKEEPIPDLVILGETTFTNASIRDACQKIMDGEYIVDKPGSFWSPIEGIGTVTQTRITSTCKSRFKGKPKQIRLSEGNMRCIVFDKKALRRVKSNYEMVDGIKIQTDAEAQKSVTLVTDVTLPRGTLPLYSTIMSQKIAANSKNLSENSNNIDENHTEIPCRNTGNTTDILLQSVTSDTSVTNQLNVKSLLKAPGSQIKDQFIIDPDPATGLLLVENNFLTGHLRMRGEGEGAYPTNYLEMIEKVFGPCDNTIEVCSGTVKGRKQTLDKSCFTVDINPECKPDLVADGQDLAAIPDNSFSRWRCDPPYNEKTASKMYNTKLPSLSKLLSEGARIVKPGSLMFLLCSQNYQWCPPSCKRIGIITMTIVPNNELRACNIYVKL